MQRQWAGLCDMTPDFSPIMDTPDLLTPFRLSRFVEGCLVGGKAAAVSHEPSLFGGAYHLHPQRP